ncbi:MAG: hypothetical protein WD063_04280 [Pirellulales bacterium]
MTTLDRAFIKAFELSTAPQTAATRKGAEAPRPPKAAPAKPPAGAPSFRATEHSDRSDQPPVAHDALCPPLPPSSFAPRPKNYESFRALLEIDRAAWPAACGELLVRAGRDWDRFTEQLIERMGQGQKCVAVASIARGDGSTTISLALAKHMAARGLRPVVVDVNPQNPTLVGSCGISAHSGWDDLLSSELPLGEALITAVEDGVTLLPWRGPAVAVSQLAGSIRAPGIFGTLREHYDLVLLDTMALVGQTTIADFASFAAAVRLDALYLIHNVRTTSPDELIAASSKLRRAGLPLAAVIENFVPPASSGEPAGPNESKAAPARELAASGDWRSD